MQPTKLLSAFLLGCLLCYSTSLVASEFAFLRPVADTTLAESYPHNNSGAVPWFNIGSIQNPAGTNAAFPYPRNRALIRFDIANSIPGDAMIESVDFFIDIAHVPPNDNSDPNQILNVHRMLRPWGEGTGTNLPPLFIGAGTGFGRPSQTGEADWYHRFAGTTNTWATPGGLEGVDFSTNVSASIYVLDQSAAPYWIRSTPEMVADVQSWLNNPDENFGWMLKVNDETAPWTAKRFISREENPFFPRLEITYSIVPEPHTTALLAAGAALIGFSWWRRR
jgi:hypothetical protein